MTATTEAFARVKVDALLQDSGWNLTDGSSILFEYTLPYGTTGQQRAPKSFIENTLVPLPSFNEQKRFAEIIQSARTTAKLADSSHKTTASLTEPLMSRLLGDGAILSTLTTPRT